MKFYFSNSSGVKHISFDDMSLTPNFFKTELPYICSKSKIAGTSLRLALAKLFKWETAVLICSCEN